MESINTDNCPHLLLSPTHSPAFTQLSPLDHHGSQSPPLSALSLQLQGIMIGYLACAWPYLHWHLQLLELVAHVLEAVIIIFAMLQMDDSGKPYMAWVMLGEPHFAYV